MTGGENRTGAGSTLCVAWVVAPSRGGSVRDLLLGRVAEWQTRWLQVPVFARTWGFKSPLAHQIVGVVAQVLKRMTAMSNELQAMPKVTSHLICRLNPLIISVRMLAKPT